MFAVKGWVPMFCAYGCVRIRALACKVHRTSTGPGLPTQKFLWFAALGSPVQAVWGLNGQALNPKPLNPKP